MLAIKLKRTGKKHQPSYRIVVQERREKLGGRYAEDLGWLNPISNTKQLNEERVKYWMSVGAQPTNTVHNLLVTMGVITAPKRAVHRVKPIEKAPEAPKAAAKETASPASEAAAPAAEAAPETPTTT